MRYLLVSGAIGVVTARRRSSTSHRVFGRDFVFFRDDQGNELLSGNKKRKFAHILSSSSDAPVLASYGGMQSNSMLAISKLAMHQRKRFLYLTSSPADSIVPEGNLKQSLGNGMEIVHIEPDEYDSLQDFSGLTSVQSSVLDKCSVLPEDVLWIPQGGCMPGAAEGVYHLGEEMLGVMSRQSKPKWKIVVASGTGTTALFLAQFFRSHPAVEVLTVPCVGTSQYLMAQMKSLDDISDRLNHFPTVLAARRTRAFAKPCAAHWAIWKSLRSQTGIDFDLLYAPRCWEVLIDSSGFDGGATEGLALYNEKSAALADWHPDCGVIYYHCGGVEGNETQLKRYARFMSRV